MKFLLDHDVPDDLSFLLIQLGHQVILLRQALPADSRDDAVLGFCYDRGCILVTCNRDDFLRLAQVKPHHGWQPRRALQASDSEVDRFVAIVRSAGDR